MTDIAWLFYIADLVSNLKVLTIITVIIFISLFVAALVGVSTACCDEEKNKLLIWLKFSVIGFFISSLLTCIIPSRATIYMAAATITVDKALESDVGKDIMEIVKFKIKEFKKEIVKNED